MHPDEEQASGEVSAAATTGFHVVCCATLVGMALTEQFANLPSAAAALVSSWYLLRH